MVWKRRRAGLESGKLDSDAPLPFRVKGKVGTIESPPGTAFFKRYVEKNRPVLIRGAMSGWKARRTWTPDYLRALVGGREGEVIVSANGLFPDYITRPEPMAKRNMPFNEFLDRARPGERKAYAPILNEAETYYIYGKSYLFETTPELKRDIMQPDCLAGVEIASLNMWISSMGCTTPLHYDLTNGLLCQIRGRKRVFLFDPGQHDLLYPRATRFPGLDNYERQSQVDIHHPDFGAFPEFKRAEAHHCLLEPGSMLFIPSNWYHEVETLELSVSVGFTFAGGTSTSQFATMAERFKQSMGSEGSAGSAMPGSVGDGVPDMAALQQQLAADPAMLMKLMASPEIQKLMSDPAVMQTLQAMMPGGKKKK